MQAQGNENSPSKRFVGRLNRRIIKLQTDAQKLSSDNSDPRTAARVMRRIVSDVKEVQALFSHSPSFEPVRGKRRLREPATSKVEHPVQIAKDFLNTNPELSRTEIIAQLVEMGVARGTASTQYQLWRKLRS